MGTGRIETRRTGPGHGSTSRVEAVETGRVGRSAVAAGVLVAAGVALEWVLDPQQRDGTVVRPVLFAACVLTSTVGSALLVAAARGLRGVVSRRGRAVRWGSALSTVGAALLLLSMIAVLVTGLASGAPAVLSFVPFALGLLLLAVGPVVLGVGLRRELPVVGGALVAAGLASFAAVAIPFDPWHDVSLMAMCGAWVLAGVLLVRR